MTITEPELYFFSQNKLKSCRCFFICLKLKLFRYGFDVFLMKHSLEKVVSFVFLTNHVKKTAFYLKT